MEGLLFLSFTNTKHFKIKKLTINKLRLLS